MKPARGTLDSSLAGAPQDGAGPSSPAMMVPPTPNGAVRSMFTERERRPDTTSRIGLPASQQTGGRAYHTAESAVGSVGSSPRSHQPAQRAFTAVPGLRIPLPDITADVSRIPTAVVLQHTAVHTPFIPEPPAVPAATRALPPTPSTPSAPSRRIISLSNPQSIDSSRAMATLSARREIITSLPRAIGAPTVPTNLRGLMRTVAAFATAKGELTATALGQALHALDVEDIVATDSLFSLLDVHRDGRVSLSLLVSTLDMAVNSAKFKHRTREACFSLFEVNSCITKGVLTKMRCVNDSEAEALRAKGITPTMVRALLSVIVDIQRLEEAEFLDSLLKGKGKKKKKPPPLRSNQKNLIPTTRRRREHMTLDTFSLYMDASTELVSSMFPRILSVLLNDGAMQHACVAHAVALASAASADDGHAAA